MTHLQLLFVASICWIAWIPASVFDKGVRDEHGSVSILPIVPFFPLVVWGAGYGLERIGAHPAVIVLGSVHFVLLLVFLASSARSKRILLARGWTRGSGWGLRAIEAVAYAGAAVCLARLGVAMAVG